MKPELQKIFDLAQHDIKILSLQKELESLQQVRDELDQSLSRKKGELEAKSGAFKELEKKRMDAEGEVQLMTSRIKEFEGKLNQIKTNKEYQAALKEITEMRKGIKEKEDVVLQAMTEIEAVKKEVETLTEESQIQLQEITKQRQEADEKEQNLQSQIEALQAERSQLLPAVDTALLNHYERIKKSRPEAVAMVDQGVCQGCFRKIPPQLLNEIRKGATIHPCPACSRLLFLPDQEPSKEAASV